MINKLPILEDRLLLMRTSTGEKSSAYRGAKVWSDLDCGLKASSSFHIFEENKSQTMTCLVIRFLLLLSKIIVIRKILYI